MRGAPLSCEVAPQYHSALSDPARKTEDGRPGERRNHLESGAPAPPQPTCLGWRCLVAQDSLTSAIDA
jgi:hypothetical protein